MIRLQLANRHGLSQLECRRFLQCRHLVHQLGSLCLIRLLVLFCVILDFLLANGQKYLLQGHVLDSVVLDAILFKIGVDLPENLMEVLQQVVAHLVHHFFSLVHMLRDGLERIVYRTVGSTQLSFDLFNDLLVARRCVPVELLVVVREELHKLGIVASLLVNWLNFQVQALPVSFL